MMTDSYEDFVQATTSNEDIQKLQELSEQQNKAQLAVERLQSLLSQAQDRLKDLAEKQVPEMMDEIGMENFKTTSGLEIKVSEVIRASIPKNRLPEGLSWLRKNGHGALIKRAVSVAFGKGEDQQAEKLKESLISENYSPEDKASVHASTLSAFVREKLKEGEELPQELLGVHRQRIAKVSAK